MKKTTIALFISPLLLAGCGGAETSSCTKESSSSSESSSISSSEAPKPISISLFDGKMSIPYGSVESELKFNVALTYSNGTIQTLFDDEYTLAFEKDSMFKTGPGKATLSYKKDPSITREVEYVVTPRKNASILFIGNSFSDDTIEYMVNVASSLGVGLTVNNLYIGGCTLNDHYDNLKKDRAAYEYRSWNGTGWSTQYNYKISTALKQTNWDFVSLQQGSGSSGIFATYSHLDECIDLIQKGLINKEHTQFIWNMTWAYQQDSTHDEFIKYGKDQMTMYNAIISCVKQLNRDVFKVVIPSGTAIQNARTSLLGDTLTRDGFHLNVGPGRYIAALNAVKAVTGIDYGEVPFSPSLDATSKAIALESVANAWEHPYEITNSRYEPSKPKDMSEEIKNMDKLPISFIRDRYYYCISPESKSGTLGPVDTFICTPIFSKADIPNGSIIRIAPGYRYRPDGWAALDTYWEGERPENVTTEYIKVDDAWWGSFNYRGFNISNTSGSSLAGKHEEAEAAFSIYIPKV